MSRRLLGNEGSTADVLEEYIQAREKMLGWPESLRPDRNLFLDLGAFIGEEISTCVKHGVPIISFEPSPSHAKSLRETWGDHELVTVIEAAASTRDGTCELFPPKPKAYASGSTTIYGKPTTDYRGGRTVQCVDMARFIAEMKEPPTILKIDVEGLEWKLLEHLDNAGVLKDMDVYVEDHADRIMSAEWHQHRDRVIDSLDVDLKRWC